MTCDLPRGEWGRFWEVAVVAARQEKSASGTPTAVEVVDLTDKVDAQQKLAWDAPTGRWTVLRFACEIIAGHENDVDILSPSAVEAYFNRMGRALLEDAGPLAGKTLTHLYSVSWEAPRRPGRSDSTSISRLPAPTTCAPICRSWPACRSRARR